MCMGPEVLIPAMLSAGGTFMNMRAQKQEQKKREEIESYYRQKNDAEQRQALSELSGTQAGYGKSNMAEMLEQAQAQREGTLPVEAAPAIEQNYAGSAPDSLKRDIGRKVVESVAKGKDQAMRTAKLNSLADAMFANSQNTIGAAQNIGQSADRVSGNARTADFESSQAYRAGDTSRGIADIFNLAGQGANLYMATGVPGKVVKPPAPKPKPAGYQSSIR